MTRCVSLILYALAANAVLIQTVVAEGSPLKNAVRATLLVVAVAAVGMRRTLVPVWLALTVLCSAFLLVLRSNPDQLSFIFVLALAPALWSIPERSLDRAMARAGLFSLALIFALLAVGLTQNVVLDFRERATFGTSGVPFFMNVVYGAGALSILYAFKYRLRSRWGVLAVALAGGLYFYRATDGRGGFFALVVFVVLLGVMPTIRRYPFGIYAVVAIPPAFLLASFYMAGQASDPNFNRFWSYRPEKYQVFLDSLSPADIVLSTTVKQTASVSNVDNSYLHLLVGGGGILFVVFCVLFARAVLGLHRRGRSIELAFLAATAVYCISESILLRIENVFIIYAWYLILRYSQSDVRLNVDASEDARRVPRDRAGGGYAGRQRAHLRG